MSVVYSAFGVLAHELDEAALLTRARLSREGPIETCGEDQKKYAYIVLMLSTLILSEGGWHRRVVKCHYVPVYALLILSDGWVEARGGEHLRVYMTAGH